MQRQGSIVVGYKQMLITEEKELRLVMTDMTQTEWVVGYVKWELIKA